MKTRVLFVCHGNICRSPMAEFIFKDLIKNRGLEDNFLVQSSATSSEEIWNGVGNPVYPPAKAELEKHNISCGDKRAVLLKKSDYDKYNLIICMDSKNMRNMLRIFGSDKDKKLFKLMDFTTRKGDVSDPWYSRNFEIAYRDIYEGCQGLLEYLCCNKI